MSYVLALFALVVSPALAAAEPQQRANAVDASLEDLRAIALDSADHAALNQNPQAENRRDAVATNAIGLALDFHQEVLRAIKLGQPRNVVRNRLQNLEADLNNLNNLVNQNGVNQVVRNAFDDVEDAWFSLESELQGGGPNPPPPPGGGAFSANCEGKFGGNFFVKQTHVECTIKGKGAVAYNVQFQNNVNGQLFKAADDGPLNPNVNQQTMISDKVSVGRFANYWVYVRDGHNKWHLVDQGQAQGNPF